jgi:hypothetical protein
MQQIDRLQLLSDLIRSTCNGKLSSPALSALHKEGRSSQKYDVIPTLDDNGKMDVVGAYRDEVRSPGEFTQNLAVRVSTLSLLRARTLLTAWLMRIYYLDKCICQLVVLSPRNCLTEYTKQAGKSVSEVQPSY